MLNIYQQRKRVIIFSFSYLFSLCVSTLLPFSEQPPALLPLKPPLVSNCQPLTGHTEDSSGFQLMFASTKDDSGFQLPSCPAPHPTAKITWTLLQRQSPLLSPSGWPLLPWTFRLRSLVSFLPVPGVPTRDFLLHHCPLLPLSLDTIYLTPKSQNLFPIVSIWCIASLCMLFCIKYKAAVLTALTCIYFL